MDGNKTEELRKVLGKHQVGFYLGKREVGEAFKELTDDLLAWRSQAVLETIDRIQNNRTTGISKFGLSAEMWDEIELIRKELGQMTELEQKIEWSMDENKNKNLIT